MKNLLIFICAILSSLALHIVVPDNAYSISPLEDLLFGKSLDEKVADIERARLKGIDDVYIVIEKVPESARRLGITEENIRTGVEIKIRKSGIKVKEKGSLVMFYVNVDVSAPINNLHAVSVKVEVRDMVSLVREPKMVFQTAIWNRGIFGMAGEQRVKEGIKDSVEELVDQFILDYLKAQQN